jgi:hypothetical protein
MKISDYGLKPNDKITVCSSCERASCWVLAHPCEYYREAGIVHLSVSELLKIDKEHPSWWRASVEAERVGQ